MLEWGSTSDKNQSSRKHNFGGGHKDARNEFSFLVNNTKVTTIGKHYEEFQTSELEKERRGSNGERPQSPERKEE